MTPGPKILPYFKRLLSLNRDIYSLVPIIVIFVLGSYITETKVVTITILTYFMFVLPGFIFFKITNLSNIKSIIYGAPLGFSITSLFIIIKVALNGWNILSISITYLILLSLVAFVAYKIARNTRYNFITDDRLSEPTKHIPFSIFLIISLYLMIIFIPLKNVGKITECGYGFTGLFSHDFILRGVSSVALAKDIPSDNYYFAGQTNHNYYILWYILPATVYNLLHMEGNIRDIISIICLLNVPFFYLLIYYTVINFIKISDTSSESHLNYKKLVLIFILILYCYSNHWIFLAMKQIAGALGSETIKQFTNQMGLLSQSWFRDIIFEPHSILSIMMILLILKLMLSKPSSLRGVIIGILLASVALTDTAIFLIFGTSYYIYNVIKILINKNFRSLIDILGTTLSGLIIASVMFAVKIFITTEYSNAIILKPYIVIIVGLPVFLILHYGVMPITSILSVKRRSFDNKKIFMLIIILVSILFMLFLTESLEGNVILRKSLKVLRLPLCLFTGYYLYHNRSTMGYKILLVLLILSFPTTLTDTYAQTNVMNKSYTTYITPEEMEAALWLKRNTPLSSVVQSCIDYPGHFDYSLTICFGERKAALGHWKIAFLSYPNKEEINRRVDEINDMFLSENNMERLNILENLNINYVFIGEREREYYPHCEMRFNNDNMHFKKVFSNGKVRIYQVLSNKNEDIQYNGGTLNNERRMKR